MSDGSRGILSELCYCNSKDKIDHSTFAVLKDFYGTLVSKYRIKICVLSWTDPAKLAGGYGTRTPVDIIKAPATMAYIMLIAVKGAKNKYDDEEVNLYTMFHSKVKNYMRIHGKDAFFCSTTRNVFTLVPKNEKNTKLRRFFSA